MNFVKFLRIQFSQNTSGRLLLTNHNKAHWSVLETFYNIQKLPSISPLLINDQFKIKANILRNFFAEQYTSLKNDGVLPASHFFLTELRLHPFEFSLDEILKIIRSLDINKAHSRSPLE